MTVPLRPEFSGMEPYGAPQRAVTARLNVNENPYAPPPAVVDAIADAVRRASSHLNRYPDRDALGLRQDLADYLAHESGATFLSADQVWAANGSNEVMLQLHQAFVGPGRTVLSCAPSYSMYPEYARTTLSSYHVVARSDDFTVDVPATVAAIAAEQPTLVIVASPNNPTGTALPLEHTAQLLDAAAEVAGGCLVVIDEAYAEFRRPGVPSATQLLPQYPHLVVSRTMSKAFALAGGRLGYAAAAPEVIDALRLVRLPYHLSALTQAAARAALAHHRELQAQVADIRTERDNTVTWLREQGFQVAESDANFVLFGLFEDREKVFRELDEHSVLVRVTGPQGWLRVSIGTPQEMALFRSALMEVTA